MKFRASYVVMLLVVAASVAAGVATCGRDDVATDVVPPTAERETGGASEERVTRRRVVRSPSGDDAAEGAGGVVSESTAGGPDDGPDDAPTGRVRVTLLRDGEPLDDAHVWFLAERVFDQPVPWDGVRCSDGAYFEIPFHVPLWQHFDPSLIRRSTQRRTWVPLGERRPDGSLVVLVAPNRALLPLVGTGEGFVALESPQPIVVGAGEEVEVTLVAAQVRPVTGRCLDSAGKPLSGIAVQAISPLEERPISRMVQTAADGAFELAVVGDDSEVRVRAAVSYPAHAFGFYASEEDVAPIPALTTVPGVLPGAEPVDVRMADAPLVFIELTVADGESPLMHLQIEGLAFDPRSSAWGRLGGPQYRAGRRGKRRAVIALPRSEAVRPLMLWSWGWTITGVDPRGRDRVSVEIPRGRRASVRGKGWRKDDHLRVVAFLGPAGQELPCIWIDSALGQTSHWSRDDSPVSEIEFQVVRDGVVIGRSARVPAGTDPAAEVTIDVE